MTHPTPLFAVIGGSGLYEIPGLSDTREHFPDTPFGQPSAPILVGTLHNQKIAFLARHGIGHGRNPSQVNYRANIYALKSLGAERVIGVNACGSLREDFRPGDLVVPNQLYDNTKKRDSSFFEEGIAVHISTADPFCGDFSAQVVEAVRSTGARVHTRGSFLIIEGPRFSTRLESNTFRSWGMSIIGMTAAPEAFLAREAELCYTTIAHITDYDVWHTSEDPVTVEMILRILNQNMERIKEAITYLCQHPPPSKRTCECPAALAGALITSPGVISEETRTRLELLIGKYIEED